MIGESLGHYQVLGKLGAGGMGEVYRALDSTLDREVALKILPVEVATDPDRLDRFAREAKALAALNHPNIVTIYTVEAVDGIHFLTMELVEGEPLSRLVSTTGMSLERFFDIAIPLSDALAAAHDRGIVHRDLKPANIMVTHGGRVKVLDFGLAKLRIRPKAEEFSEMATEPLTQEGLVVGTVPYMSPEQLEGRELDSRSDIFSLGIILYEMSTGQRPFCGDTTIAVISSIVKDSPAEIDALRDDLPHHLGRIVRHCLEKDPDGRFQTSRDVRNELKDLRQEGDSAKHPLPSPPKSARSRKNTLRFSAVLAALLLVISVGVWQQAKREPRQTPQATAVEAPPRIVVLPFENLGPPEDEYFADGITEEITSRLSAVSSLSVISRTTATQYKENRPPLARIARDLNIDYALEGTVRWARTEGDQSRVRITPQLIRVADDTNLWSDSYDRILDDTGPGAQQPCDPANDVASVPGARGNTDCIPTGTFNPCGRIALIPTSTNCVPGGTCDDLGKLSQCTANQFCVTGGLPLPLDPATGSYNAGDGTTDALFGWFDNPPSDVPAIDSPFLKVDGTWNIIQTTYTGIAGPAGLAVNAGGLAVQLECIMGTDAEDATPPIMNASFPTEDVDLLSFPVQ